MNPPSLPEKQISPDGRFRIEWGWDEESDIIWHLINNETDEILRTYISDITRVTVKKVIFDKTGSFAIARNGLGKVLEKIDLTTFDA